MEVIASDFQRTTDQVVKDEAASEKAAPEAASEASRAEGEGPRRPSERDNSLCLEEESNAETQSPPRRAWEDGAGVPELGSSKAHVSFWEQL